eukprot:gnl/TRDRNA2_/TRDRNA2_165551_c1_seq1.p5 gnl/TRDRNA2_/TRDRNA2_165551_c1~~gnl/TRDRNA2_/TRDRNA2_165551_c1_seq1.p5  ORF type:complete len:110 (+),score=19.88 gnl/TRDRNA2_/TRDRNA2_165551_c1_seq1:896-1225(+)
MLIAARRSSMRMLEMPRGRELDAYALKKTASRSTRQCFLDHNMGVHCGKWHVAAAIGQKFATETKETVESWCSFACAFLRIMKEVGARRCSRWVKEVDAGDRCREGGEQ